MKEIIGTTKTKDGRKQYRLKCTECNLISHVRVSKYDKDSNCKRCNTIKRNKEGRGSGVIYGPISKTFLNYFKCAARRRKVHFDLSLEYANSIWTGYCALSNLKISAPSFTDSNGNVIREGNTASLDRIDSSKPYIEGNVQWVHKTLNIMKNGIDQKEFIYLCHMVASSYANQQPSVLKGNRKVNTKVQRLESEDIPTNNLSTSAEHPLEGDDIVRHSEETQRDEG